MRKEETTLKNVFFLFYFFCCCCCCLFFSKLFVRCSRCSRLLTAKVKLRLKVKGVVEERDGEAAAQQQQQHEQQLLLRFGGIRGTPFELFGLLELRRV
jgi:hypothetical protein